MQFKLFAIPVTGDQEAEDELNRFLRAHRAISVQREVVRRDSSAVWVFCIEYLTGPRLPADMAGGRQRVDYKAVLSEEDFSVFARLREVRKQLAAQDAVPVYAVCTNEQLAEIAKARPATLAELKRIEGLGEAKAEKHGEAILQALRLAVELRNGESDAARGTSD